MLSFSARGRATAAHRETDRRRPVVQARANWGDRPQGTPRLVLQRNPRPIRKTRGDARQTGGGPWSGGVRLRNVTGLVSAPAFAWGEGGSGASRESKTPIAGTDEPEGMGQ